MPKGGSFPTSEGFEGAAAVSVPQNDVPSTIPLRKGRWTITFGGTGALNNKPGYRFVVTAEDRSRSGHNDRFRIVITGPQGSNFRYDSGDGGRNGGRIDRGGNIVINPADDDED